MAHFAEVANEDSHVIRVVVIADDEISDARFANGLSEAKGIARCLEIWPDTGDSTWVQTFKYDEDRTRKHFAGPGMFWDEANDGFYFGKPYASWVYHSDRCQWGPPTPKPVTTTTVGEGEEAVEAADDYDWDEETTAWIKR